jgi:uncharacterized membrane protein YoaK (UPF0700 family)
MPSIRTTTVAVSLASILPILCLGVVTGDFKKGNWWELVFAALFFFSPSIALAYLGYRRTNSRALPILLMVSSILSTALWLHLALFFWRADVVDAQSGLAVVFYFGIQLVIVVLATLSFLLMRKR